MAKCTSIYLKFSQQFTSELIENYAGTIKYQILGYFLSNNNSNFLNTYYIL